MNFEEAMRYGVPFEEHKRENYRCPVKECKNKERSFDTPHCYFHAQDMVKVKK